MLYEIQNVRQNEGEPERRWFVDDYFDLIIWLNDKEAIEGFQLCYNKSENQHALTWHAESGYMHNRVDDGEDKAGKPKSIPVLVADGDFRHDEIAEIFRQESKNLDPDISGLIYEKIMQYSGSDFEKNENDMGILQAVLDYIEGWYEGNAERVERSLHPELAKRRLLTGTEVAQSSLGQMSAMSVVRETKYAGMTSVEKQQKDIDILNIFGRIASVRLTAFHWVEYLHMAKFNERWLIVNILRELKAK